MTTLHTFPRPDQSLPTRQVGERWSEAHDRYDEGTRYLYRHSAHELTLFWDTPTPAEIDGVRSRPIEVGLHVHGPAAFLLYKIDQVCEWSDVAFNVHLVPEGELELPQEPPGERARLRITLVDARDGVVRAKRIVSFDKVMTQALRHTMTEQARQDYDRAAYDAAVREAHGRFPDTDAMARAAEVLEPALG